MRLKQCPIILKARVVVIRWAIKTLYVLLQRNCVNDNDEFCKANEYILTLSKIDYCRKYLCQSLMQL